MHVQVEDERRPPTEGSKIFRDQSLDFVVLRAFTAGWPINDQSQDNANSEHVRAKNNLVVKTLDKLPAIQEMAAALRRQQSGGQAQEEANEMAEVGDEYGEDNEEEQDEEELEEQRKTKALKEEQERLLLQRKTTLTLRPILDPIDPLLYPLLRWIICSNRSFIRELLHDREKVAGVGDGYLQVRGVISLGFRAHADSGSSSK